MMTATSDAERDATEGANYRFESFRTGLLIDDMRFRPTAPGPGDRVPSFDLPTLDGGTFSSDALGARPVLMIFGSQTCPVTQSALPRLRTLHDEFVDQIRFVFVNTREAHPGERIPQPETDLEKRAHAAALRAQRGIDYEVAVDNIDGTLHRYFTPKPNSAYLLQPDGTIAYRVHWANDDRGLRRAIIATLNGANVVGRSRATVRPLMRAVGHLPDIVQAGGKKIERDVWRAAPPLALLARVSNLLRRLPIDRRGPIAGVVVAATTVLVTAGAVWIPR